MFTEHLNQQNVCYFFNDMNRNIQQVFLKSSMKDIWESEALSDKV